MKYKEKILAAIKANQVEQLVKADKWLSLHDLYPLGTSITYKGEQYRIIGSFAYSSYVARPFSKYTNKGEDLNLMDLDLDNIAQFETL